jgi:hypothetical protein
VEVPTYVAPHMTIEEYDDSKRLQVFHSRTRVWILNHAIEAANREDGGISSLIIATSVFEPMGAILLDGRGNKEARFIKGFEYVFPKMSGISDRMYRCLRGGLYHEGFITGELVICALDEPVVTANDTIYIEPKRFAPAVATGFDEFCTAIEKDENGIRKKFDSYWTKQAEVNEKVLGERKPKLDLPFVLSTSGGYGYYSGAVPASTTYDLFTPR